jgi:cytochrome P450
MDMNAGTLGDIFDPLAPEQMESPFAVYARARREEPVFYSKKYGVWVVTRYSDLSHVTRDTASFSSANALEAKTEPSPEVRAVLRDGYMEFQSLVQSDPPDHTRIRNVFNKALSASRIAAMEPQVRGVANRLIDAFVNDGEVDLISKFAFPFPGAVICLLLGVPLEDLPQIKQWSIAKQVLLAAQEENERLVECARDFVALQRYFRDHIERRVKEPRDDLLTLLVPAEIGGTAPLTMQEAVCNAMDLLAAGHETTTDLIGNGLRLFMSHPEQLAQLRADMSLLPAALDEVLRAESPVRGLFRKVTTQVELGGARIPAGARLFLLYGSGNRDETVFERSEEFDIHRKTDVAHLAFGKGIHYCVGNALARLEGKIALELLLTRLPNVRRDSTREAVRRPYLILWGFERLPIRWDLPS